MATSSGVACRPCAPPWRLPGPPLQNVTAGGQRRLDVLAWSVLKGDANTGSVALDDATSRWLQRAGRAWLRAGRGAEMGTTGGSSAPGSGAEVHAGAVAGGRAMLPPCDEGSRRGWVAWHLGTPELGTMRSTDQLVPPCCPPSPARSIIVTPKPDRWYRVAQVQTVVAPSVFLGSLQR